MMISSRHRAELVPARSGHADGAEPRFTLLLSMVFALALVVSAVASLNVALPDIASGTGASQTQLQWIVDGYAVVFAGLVLPAGALGDRFGRRRGLVSGLLVFGTAYGVGAALSDPTWLIGARALAGIGAALIMPATLSILTTAFPPARRARAVGAWAGIAGGGAVIGLLLSGVILELANWRWVFAANAVWASLALVFAMRWAPESRSDELPSIDLVGAVLSAGGLSAVVYATIEGPHRGWTDALVVAGYVVGALALTGFVLWELTRERPMLDPRLFANRAFTHGSLSIALQFLAFFGFIFVGLQYLQLVLGYSPLQGALALLPLAAAIGAGSRVIAPTLMARLGAGRVNCGGLAVAAVGFVLLAGVDGRSSYWSLLLPLVVLGLGVGAATTPATSSIVASLSVPKQGVASAVNDAAREVGGAVGIAVFGSVLAAGYHRAVDPHLHGLPATAASHAHDSLAFVDRAVSQLGPTGRSLLTVARDGFVQGMHTACWIAAAVLAVGAVLFAIRPQGKAR